MSRDTAEGEAFLVACNGEERSALAFLKRGKVQFRTADGSVLPADAQPIGKYVPAEAGGVAGPIGPPLAIVEWKGERVHGLAVSKRGGTFYRTANNRLLGRATIIDELVLDSSSIDPEPNTEGIEEVPAQSGQFEQEAATAAKVDSDPLSTLSHWADAIPEPPAQTTAAPAATANTSAIPEPSTQPADPAPEAAVSRPAADADNPNPMALTFDGFQWVGPGRDGKSTIVWHGDPSIAVLDTEIAETQHTLDQLTALRELLDRDHGSDVVAHIKRFAAVDGITDLDDATEEQRAAWRRYAEGIVGDR